MNDRQRKRRVRSVRNAERRLQRGPCAYARRAVLYRRGKRVIRPAALRMAHNPVPIVKKARQSQENEIISPFCAKM